MLSFLPGNHYGLGARRKIEQKNSCTVFGVLADNCKVLDLPELQDDPVAVWPNDKIQTILADHVSQWHIDTVSLGFRLFNIPDLSGGINLDFAPLRVAYAACAGAGIPLPKFARATCFNHLIIH
jgi:hypothetical protein